MSDIGQMIVAGMVPFFIGILVIIALIVLAAFGIGVWIGHAA